MSSACIDFETYYDKDYSLKKMTPYDYVQDRRFDPYLVAVHGDDVHYVGPPENFDWTLLSGYDIVAHNMAFDGLVLRRLIELGRVPDFPRREFCTADLAAYLLVPRYLAGAVLQLFDVKLSKQVRSDMLGRTLTDTIVDGSYDDLMEYADSDALWSHKIWVEHAHKWPEWEREASRLTRESCWRGVKMDRRATEAGLRHLESVQAAAEEMLPWVGQQDDKGKDIKTNSRKYLSLYLRGKGVVPPVSYKKDDPEFMALVADLKQGRQFLDVLQQGGELPEDVSLRKFERMTPDQKVAAGLGTYVDIPDSVEVLEVLEARLEVASLAGHIARLRNMLASADDNDILRFSRRYFGAHTGRDASGEDRTERSSGSLSIFNPLNLPKDPVCGVNLRNLLLPRDGRKFLIFDFSQIEALVILWLAGHTEMLEKAKASGSLYIAYGILTGKIKPEDVDTEAKRSAFKGTRLYAALKASVLGFGFGQGAVKFRETVAKQSKGKLVFTAEESKELTDEWRQSNAPVCRLWGVMGDEFKMSAMRNEPVFWVDLPSGRRKPYYRPQVKVEPKRFTNPETGEEFTKMVAVLRAALIKGEMPWGLWGGELVQHATQATARDVMTLGGIEVCRQHPNWWWAWSVYDEVIFEIPEDEAQEALVDIPKILCEGIASQTWARGLPLKVEGGVFDKYLKM